MSGEHLRNAAMMNDFAFLEESIKARANVCSADEWGLTALHYACWNGHVESVLLLAFNSHGVDARGERVSCLNMRSCIGLTPLHLVAMDCPERSVAEITRALLLTGADPRVEDEHRCSSYALARRRGNRPFLEALQEYIEVRNGARDAAEYQSLFDSLVEKYQFIVPKEGRRKLDAEYLQSLPFEPPEFLTERERIGPMPNELAIHEHHILPLAEEFKESKGINALKALQFVSKQSAINEQRRLQLVEKGKSNG